MPITKDDLVDVLRVRYDAYSAEAVFTNACARAGLEGTTTFDARALAAFRTGVEQVGDRVVGVLARLDALLGDGAPVSARQPAETSEATSEEKAEAKAEPKSEAKVDAKADAKADAPAKTDGASARAAETTIVLRGLDADDDEQLLVCGASPSIGDWDPERAHPMTRVGDEWLMTLELPADAEVAFKFLRRDADGEVSWEAGGNRVVRANERLDATWRELS
jgi:hypothetical protein